METHLQFSKFPGHLSHARGQQDIWEGLMLPSSVEFVVGFQSLGVMSFSSPTTFYTTIVKSVTLLPCHVTRVSRQDRIF